MEELFLILCVIQLCLEVFALVKLKCSKEEKYWNLFIGISIAGFISTILAYVAFEKEALGLGDALACLIVCGFSLVSNLIVLIIGMIVKRKIKDKSIKLGKRFFVVCLLVVAINAICLFVVPAIEYQVQTKKGEKFVVDYLDKKYGDGNFEIVNVYKMYENSGMWDKYLAGYYYEVKSDYIEATFIVTIDDSISYIEQDYFLPVYFSEKNNFEYKIGYVDGIQDLDYNFTQFDEYVDEIIKTRYAIKKVDALDIYLNYVASGSSDSKVKYSWNYYIVPSDNGKIPTIEELISSMIKASK